MGYLLKKCLLGIGISILLSGLSYAQGNIAAGQMKSTTCAACHGAKGSSASPLWPNLAGQGEKYLYQQLQAFKKGKDGERYDPSMSPLMADLSDQDMQDLAAYYASQTIVAGQAKKERLESGQTIYRGGIMQKSLVACISCHGPKGLGNREAAFPLVSGQHPEYVVQQLENYKNGTRTTGPNDIMQDIAKRMSKQDMQDVANYIAGLH